jgi:tetratricopeptide (TPR) repeat protein
VALLYEAVDKMIFRCGDIEIDPARACVKRGGQEQHLRQQTFHVLLYLIERRERVVTKEELLETIWHDTAVTDNALVQCIADIRKALGDDPRNPRFIKTAPKVGYIFIGTVNEHQRNGFAGDRPAGADLGTDPSDILVAAPKALSRPAARFFGRKRSVAILLVIILAAVVGLSIIAIGMFGRSSRQRAEITLPQVPGKKAVAVMYFENQSDNQGLEWLCEGLTDMLITDLARSNKLTVLSRQQLHLLIERSGHKPADRIRLDDALDVARKSHADAVLLGSFASFGEQLRIDVQIYETSGGQLTAAERLVVDSLNQILTQVDLLSLKLTAHLGVPPSELGKKAGLAEVMTDNLEAYRYYSLGLEKAQGFENAQAIVLFQKAIELDPKFAMAYARIGYAYAVTDFLPEKGRPYLEKAFQLSDRLSEKDKLYITAWYAIARGDYPNAVKMFRQLIAQYPFEPEAYWRLGRLLRGEEQVDEAIQVIRQGLIIDPEAKDLYNGLGIALLSQGRYDEAIAAHQHYTALAPNEPNAHDSLGMSYQQSGRYGEATAEYQKALALNPEFEPAIIHLGDVYFQQGKYREAVSQYQRYIEVTQSDLARSIGYSSIAYVHWRRGDIDRADQAAKKEMLYAKGAVWNSLVIALERKDGPKARKLKESLFESLPSPQRGARHDQRSYDYFRGYLALKAKSNEEAVAHFKEALRHLPTTSGIESYEDCLANAYLELEKWDEAIAEYHRILSRNPNYPFAHYRLGQAYERKGDDDRARAEYAEFINQWKNADPDIPEVIDAKRRFASGP